MFDVKVDHSETVSLHDQVAAEIRRAIADGEAGPGERLPLAKDMAAVLGVNKNTVLRRAAHLARGRPPRVPARAGHHGRRHSRAERSGQAGS